MDSSGQLGQLGLGSVGGHAQRWESKSSPVMVSSSSSLIRISSSHSSSEWEAEASQEVVEPGTRAEVVVSSSGCGEEKKRRGS